MNFEIYKMYKDAQEGAFEEAFNGVFEVGLSLYLFMHLSMHKNALNDSITCELKGVLYVAFEGTPIH